MLISFGRTCFKQKKNTEQIFVLCELGGQFFRETYFPSSGAHDDRVADVDEQRDLDRIARFQFCRFRTTAYRIAFDTRFRLDDFQFNVFGKSMPSTSPWYIMMLTMTFSLMKFNSYSI